MPELGLCRLLWVSSLRAVSCAVGEPNSAFQVAFTACTPCVQLVSPVIG